MKFRRVKQALTRFMNLPPGRSRLVFLLLALPLAVAARDEPLQEFTESGGCRLRGSMASVTRQREIAAQGSVTWEGRCVGGYIDGPGNLRHQGLVLESGRSRRYAFHLTGVARAGMRTGSWRRESFNMFEDGDKYWTSLATINYADGVAKGAAKARPARGNDDFSPSFRQFLAGIDRELAARNNPRRTDDRAATSAPAPLAASQAPPVPVPPPAAAAPPSPTAPAAPQLALAQPRSPAPSSGGTAAVPDSRGNGLKLLATPGTRLPAPAPPALPQQQILEQRGTCAIDQINGRAVGEDTIAAASSQPLRVAGWAADPNKPRAPEPPHIPERAWIRFYERNGGPGLLVDMPRNAERPDVARALGHAGYARAGFRITVDPGRLRPGEYTVAIVQGFGADLAICSSIGRLSLH